MNNATRLYYELSLKEKQSKKYLLRLKNNVFTQESMHIQFYLRENILVNLKKEKELLISLIECQKKKLYSSYERVCKKGLSHWLICKLNTDVVSLIHSYYSPTWKDVDDVIITKNKHMIEPFKEILHKCDAVLHDII
jgi:hypothetical protein